MERFDPYAYVPISSFPVGLTPDHTNQEDMWGIGGLDYNIAPGVEKNAWLYHFW